MTTSEDPFATPAAETPPAPAAPGMIAGATPPPIYAPPPGVPMSGGSGYRPETPKGLATWFIVLSGLWVVFGVVGALLSPITVKTLRDAAESGSTSTTFSPDQIVSFLLSPIQLGAFIVLALWWGRIRAIRKSVGYEVGGLPAVEWWGWFIPFANYVLPVLGMRSLTKRLVGPGALLGWWLPFCAYWLTSVASVFVVFGAIDWQTGGFADTSGLGVIVSISWSSAALLAISWAFLVYIVRKTTARADERV
jgi:hypothetical protein